ncbi:hypothetical protein KIH74_24175 [Kineosporia sp. J2-2]|uniref:Uncharacterized protein n=1 Tax=Kineosporia corallincola TaxID=2835133 RepID=A0ABS5TLT3_9ACTN|nr:hypothetical protein [Kineosporia corallincola]MBT0772062.1 hypothetical protein [Kineosporia corallincola]
MAESLRGLRAYRREERSRRIYLVLSLILAGVMVGVAVVALTVADHVNGKNPQVPADVESARIASCWDMFPDNATLAGECADGRP